MKPTTYLLLIALSFSACKKDDDQSTPELAPEEEHPSGICLPTTEVYTAPNISSSKDLYYYTDGKLRKEIAEKGVTTYYYNSAGDILKKEFKPNDSGETASDNYVYDGNGNLLYEYYKSTTGEISEERIYSYNNKNQLIKEFDKRWGLDTEYYYTYNEDGKVATRRRVNPRLPGNEEEKLYYYLDDGRVVDEHTYLYINGDTTYYRWYQYEYDSDGNEIKYIEINVNDPNYRSVRTSEWDSYGNLIKKTWYDSNGLVLREAIITIEYDNLGNILSEETYFEGKFQRKYEYVITCWD